MRGGLHALLLLLPAAVATAAPARPDRSVLLLIGDDHGRHVGAYGDPVARTPHIDGLATRGTRFENAFATVSSCSSSRAVMLTGLHTHQNGQYGLAHAVHNQSTFEWVETLPSLLSRSGYRTGLVGKKHVKPDRLYPFDVEVAGPALAGNRNVAAMAEAAGAFLRDSAGRAFFLVIGFSDPHREFQGRRSFPGLPARPPVDPSSVRVPAFLPDLPEVRADLADYYESVQRLDAGVGLVLDELRKAGRERDTLVVYLSDNGMPFPGAKTNLYDAGIRLPLVAAAPAAGRRGVGSRAMVSFVDLAPTLLDWAGVPGPSYPLPGRSWLGILEQEDAPGWDEVYASHQFHEIHMYYPMRAVRTRRFALLRNLLAERPYPLAKDILDSPTWKAMRASGVPDPPRRPAEELYDVAADPDQARNLAADPAHAATLAELRRKLDAFAERTKDAWAVGERPLP
jgi:N-sulfoglucosamine sulfohydrolase